MRQLDDAALANYLNDHLAGSVAALQLMGRICDEHTECRLGRLMAELRADVEGEQEQLKLLLQSIDKPENPVAQTFAWVGEQISRLKISAGQNDETGVRLFEALEALLLGFTGRLSLWTMLAEVQDVMPLPFEFRALAARAQEHIVRLEAERVSAGRTALMLAAEPLVTA